MTIFFSRIPFTFPFSEATYQAVFSVGHAKLHAKVLIAFGVNHFSIGSELFLPRICEILAEDYSARVGDESRCVKVSAPW